MTIGIPRSLFYYLEDITECFLEQLNIKVIVSPKTNKHIIDEGNKWANDEMCLSVKNYLGHVSYLKDKCDYILVPRIDNYYTFNQTCTNFLAMPDIVRNIFDINILTYNIDLNNKQTLKKGLFNIGKKLNKNKKEINKAYHYAINKYKKQNKMLIKKNLEKLNSNNTKVLLVSHDYNTYDEAIGKPIIEQLKKMGVDIIYSTHFDKKLCRKLSENLSKDLYWKLSKESLGALDLVKNKVDGILFLSTFPCGLDSLTNELVMLKLNLPYLNIVIDDLSATNGIETRIESFVDIIKKFE